MAIEKKQLTKEDVELTKEDVELLKMTFWAFMILKGSRELQRFFKKMLEVKKEDVEPS